MNLSTTRDTVRDEAIARVMVKTGESYERVRKAWDDMEAMELRIPDEIPVEWLSEGLPGMWEEADLIGGETDNG